MVAPKLRFKDDEGRQFPEWVVTKIADLNLYISDGNYGEQYPTSDQMVGFGVPFIRANNIKGLKLVWDDMRYITPDHHKILTSGHLKPHDILITTRGEIGSVAFVNDEFGGANINAQICLLRVQDIQQTDPKYLIQALTQQSSQKQFKELQTGSALKQLPKSSLGKLTIQIPCLLEQTKIANFLTAVDAKISQLTKKHELLTSYKKGVMQKIFNQELRFKDNDGREFPEREEKNLGDICSITTGKLDANAMTENGEYRFYTCAKEYYRIDNYAFDTNALLVSGNGANVGYIHHYKGKFNAYQRTYVLDKFDENIIFIKFFLDSFLHIRIFKEAKEGNTPYIVMGTLTEMLIQLPTLEEQTKIANFLTAIDDKITNVKSQLEAAKEYKQGLLQQMFV